MKKLALTVALVGLVAAPALGSWDHPVKWDQLEPFAGWGKLSVINSELDGGLVTAAADDWMCDETGWITDIHFHGWSYWGTEYVEQFRVTIWDDVPAVPGVDESHPGNLLHEAIVDPEVDPAVGGWIEENADESLFAINLPQNDWFWQEEGNIYWVGIQGIMEEDGYADYFYWGLIDLGNGNLDDSVFLDDGATEWAHNSWVDDEEGGYEPSSYMGPAPLEDPLYLGSADLSFYLTGIPEPASIALMGLGAIALIRRR